jgi:hypothetical protein
MRSIRARRSAVRMVVSGDVDAVTAVEFQHAAIDVLRWQRPPCIEVRN